MPIYNIKEGFILILEINTYVKKMIQSNNDKKFNLYKSLKNIVKRMKKHLRPEIEPGLPAWKRLEETTRSNNWAIADQYKLGDTKKYLTQKIWGSVVRNVSLALRSIIRLENMVQGQ